MNRSILIIDDSRSLRRQLCDMLSPSGLFAEFREAGDGMEGFRLLLDRPADVILRDLEMPGLDGGKFLRLTASLGAAVYPGGGIATIEDLIQAADQVLYLAKEAGRNRLEIAENEKGQTPPPAGN